MSVCKLCVSAMCVVVCVQCCEWVSVCVCLCFFWLCCHLFMCRVVLLFMLCVSVVVCHDIVLCCGTQQQTHTMNTNTTLHMKTVTNYLILILRTKQTHQVDQR